MKIFGYVRVSGRGQVTGDGPERQREAIEKFCALLFPQKIIFVQEQITGTSEAMDRPAFSAMMDAGPEVIIVERMDRLARDLMVSEVLLKECRERGIKVYSTDQGALIDMASDGGDPTRVLIRQFVAALAQWEKSNLVKKLRGARERKFAAGNIRALGAVPYGLQDASEAANLNYIVQLWDAFKYKPSAYAKHKAIAATLNDCGIKTRGGHAWSTQNIRDTLQTYNKQKERGWRP